METKFILNSNGKIDRKKLPKPDFTLLSSFYEPLNNPTEIKVGEIFKKYFNIVNLSLNDDFFQLGGHSLMETFLLLISIKHLK